MLVHEQLGHCLLSLRVLIVIVLLQGHSLLRMLVELWWVCIHTQSRMGFVL